MLGRVVGRELREWRRSPAMFAAWTVVLGATLLVTTVSSARTAVVADAHGHANTAEHARWIGMGDLPVHKAAHVALHAVRELSRLAAIDPGISDYAGPVIWLEAHRRNDPIERPANRASEATRLSAVSASVLLQLVLPLIVIMAGYAAISGEREHGTLAMAVASGLSIRVLVMGKVLALMLAVGATSGIVELWSYAAGGFHAGARLLAVMTLLGIYALLFVGGTVLVSSRAGSSRAALALLLVVWLANGLFLPRLGASAVETTMPLPSARSVRSEIARAVDVLDVRDELERRTQALMAERGVVDRAELALDLRGLEYLLIEDASNAIHDEKLAPLLSGLRLQTWWYQWIGFASPQVAVLLVSQALAGTDVLAHLAFVDSAERYRRDLQRTLSESILYSNQGEGPPVGDRDLWRRVPAFVTPTPSLADIVAFYWPALLALVVWIVALGSALWRATGRATAHGA